MFNLIHFFDEFVFTYLACLCDFKWKKAKAVTNVNDKVAKMKSDQVFEL